MTEPVTPIFFVLADSLALPRPNEGVLAQETWPFLVLDALKKRAGDYHMYHRGLSGATVTELAWHYQHRIEPFLDPPQESIAVLHCGICDCAPRPIPGWLRSLISLLPGFVRGRIILFLHRNRAKILRLGLSFRATSPRQYKKKIREILQGMVVKYSHVIVVLTAPAEQTYEKKNPGITRAIERSNRDLRMVLSEFPKARIVDLPSLFGLAPESGRFISSIDNHHLLHRGHQALADDILKKLGARE